MGLQQAEDDCQLPDEAAGSICDTYFLHRLFRSEHPLADGLKGLSIVFHSQGQDTWASLGSVRGCIREIRIRSPRPWNARPKL